MKTIDELQAIFRDIFDDNEIVLNNETTSDDIEDWDSLTHMQLIVEIEQKYNIRFTTAEIKKATNIGEFVQIIEAKL